MKSDIRITRHPILVGTAVVWTGWLILISNIDGWSLFASKWFMTLTMVFGSFIAGATSEGGGAVAFPVMTLLFKIDPVVARDFSILIQSVGMMAASFTIYCLKIPVVWRAIVFAGLGGAAGIIIGLEFIAPLFSSSYTKLFFVSVWLSFACALYLINLNKKREVLINITNFNARNAWILFFVGMIGGIVSGITGSGLDIVTFSLLVLAFRICEKVATPTSVVLMGTNALFGLIWREGFSVGMQPEAWEFWYVCVPVVVIGAPVGAWFIKNRSRHFVAMFIYLSIAVQYIAAILIIPLDPSMLVFSIGALAVGLLLFWFMARIGSRRLEANGDNVPS
jgi:uncharacterized membrane protein YfcA